MGSADAEVHHFVSVADGDVAFVDTVVADFPNGVVRGSWGGFGQEVVGGFGGVTSDAAVGSDRVVVGAEVVEVFLQGGNRSDLFVAVEEDFQVFPDAFDFALGGGFICSAVFLDDALECEQCFESVAVAASV